MEIRKKGEEYPQLNGMLNTGSSVLNKSGIYLLPTTKLKKKSTLTASPHSKDGDKVTIHYMFTYEGLNFYIRVRGIAIKNIVTNIWPSSNYLSR